MNESQARPVIALMTDFGLGDGDVGIMKGVIAGITPQAHIIDITHDIAPQNVPSAVHATLLDEVGLPARAVSPRELSAWKNEIKTTQRMRLAVPLLEALGKDSCSVTCHPMSSLMQVRS